MAENLTDAPETVPATEIHGAKKTTTSLLDDDSDESNNNSHVEKNKKEDRVGRRTPPRLRRLTPPRVRMTQDTSSSSPNLVDDGAATQLKQPVLRKVVSGPAAVVKGARNRISNRRLNNNNNKHRGTVSEDLDTVEDEDKIHDENHHRESCLEETLDCAVEALEKPFVEVENAFKRPGKRKYKKVAIETKAEEAIDTVKEEAVEEPMPETVETPASTPASQTKVSPLAQSVETPKSSDAGVEKEVVMGPFMSFLFSDLTIMVGVALVVGVVPTAWNWSTMTADHVPWTVTLGWVVAAYVIGEEFGRSRGPRRRQLEDEMDASVPLSVRSSLREERNHSIFLRASRRLSTERSFRFHPKGRKKQRSNRFAITMRRLRSRRRNKWKENITPPSSSDLNQWLNQDSSLRLSIAPGSIPQQIIESSDSTMGAFDISQSPATSLLEPDVEPLLQLRGMDIFLADGDGGEDDIGGHPYLVEGGLREMGTCLVNVLLPWGNMLIYFELPEWFGSFDKIVEKEDDPDNVKALKRFMNGDDEYKVQRIRLIPCIVDGPRIIRLLAPSRTEIAIPPALVPMSFKRVPASIDGDGNTRHPLIEVELDCMSNKAVRAMAGVFKRNLHRLTLDLAVLIRSPHGTEDEPSACLGMWRYDKIDVDSCPVLPKREDSEELQIRRASAVVGLSPEDMLEIEQEA